MRVKRRNRFYLYRGPHSIVIIYCLITTTVIQLQAGPAGRRRRASDHSIIARRYTSSVAARCCGCRVPGPQYSFRAAPMFERAVHPGIVTVVTASLCISMALQAMVHAVEFKVLGTAGRDIAKLCL